MGLDHLSDSDQNPPTFEGAEAYRNLAQSSGVETPRAEAPAQTPEAEVAVRAPEVLAAHMGNVNIYTQQIDGPEAWPTRHVSGILLGAQQEGGKIDLHCAEAKGMQHPRMIAQMNKQMPGTAIQQHKDKPAAHLAGHDFNMGIYYGIERTKDGPHVYAAMGMSGDEQNPDVRVAFDQTVIATGLYLIEKARETDPPADWEPQVQMNMEMDGQVLNVTYTQRQLQEALKGYPVSSQK